MNLLITDDEIIAVKAMISGIDWKRCKIDQVFTANSVQQAIEVFKENNIDILLCDIEMPKENGLALLKWVKENNPLVECIFLSCHAEFSYAKEAMKLGCFDYVLKPAHFEDIEELIIKVRLKLIERKREVKLLDYGEKWLYSLTNSKGNNDGEVSPSRKLVRNLELYIMKNISDTNLSVESLAKMVYLNADYLNRVFKKERGISLKKYIINERMELAGRLLIETSSSAHDISELVGYNNYTNFVSMFKKVIGVSPSMYKRHKENI